MRLTAKFILSFVAIMMIFISFISILSFYDLYSTRDLAVKSAEETGQSAINITSKILNSLAEKSLISFSEDTAAQVSEYILHARLDILILADFKKDEKSYLSFIIEHSEQIHNRSSSAPISGISFPFEQDPSDVEIVPMYNSVRYIDENGMELIRIDHNKPSKDLRYAGDKDYFIQAKKLRKGQIYVSRRQYTIWDCTNRTSTLFVDPFYELGSECPDRNILGLNASGYRRVTEAYIRYSTPVYEGNVFRGVVTFDLNFLPVMKIINDVKVGKTGYAFLEQSIEGTPEHDEGKGITVAHPSHQFVGLMDPATLYKLEDPGLDDLRILSQKQHIGETGISRYVFRGVDKYTSYSAFNESGIIWSVGIAEPVGDFTEPISEMESRLDAKIDMIEVSLGEVIHNSIIEFILISLAMMSLLIFSAFILVRSLINPLKRLSDGVGVVSRGDLEYRTRINTQDEVGNLSKAFDDMTSELEKLKKHLEREVSDKTKELNKRVEELEKFQKFSIGRELKMVELKKEIERLKGRKKNGKRKVR